MTIGELDGQQHSYHAEREKVNPGASWGEIWGDRRGVGMQRWKVDEPEYHPMIESGDGDYVLYSDAKAIEDDRDALKAWKESAMDVEKTWDVQAIGNEMGLALGSPIREHILPYIKKLKEELENERIRLAGCGVAAMANTDETVKQRIGRDSPYWSASYGDVCDAVDREMKLRSKLSEVLKEA